MLYQSTLLINIALVLSFITAVDFANRTTIAVSEPILIDYSPPDKTNKPITLPNRHITSTSDISTWYV
jgi:hypothetical protein